MIPTEFHPECLSDRQRRVLHRLGPAASAAGFYLAGGTAVAIRLGHRRSVDFDWFTASPIADPLALAARFASEVPPFAVGGTAPDTLHGEVDSVRCSFLTYRYPAIVPHVRWPDYGCDLASIEDLACMKLAAIAQRGARRDFVDIDALLEAGLDLVALLEAYRVKYAVRDTGHVLAALAYFDDAEKEPMPDSIVPVRWDELTARVRARIRAAAG
jgi:hypothetical protein